MTGFDSAVEDRHWAAVVLAAGKGTRMKSEVPKVLHKILGKPMVGYVLDLVAQLKIEETVVVVGHKGDLVEDHCRDYSVRFVLQKEQRGTAHAVSCALRALDNFKGNVLILCGDTPLFKRTTLEWFMARHSNEANMLSVLSGKMSDPTGYGRILRSPEGKVLGIREEKDASSEEKTINEINTGVYACDAAFLSYALNRVGCNNAQQEYYLTDIVSVGYEKEVPLGAYCLASEEEIRGVNSRFDLSCAEAILLKRIQRQWMMKGVTFEMAGTIYIEPSVTLDPDVLIGPHCVIKGHAKIGRGARLGAFCYIDGANIAPGAEIAPYSYIVEME